MSPPMKDKKAKKEGGRREKGSSFSKKTVMFMSQYLTMSRSCRMSVFQHSNNIPPTDLVMEKLMFGHRG